MYSDEQRKEIYAKLCTGIATGMSVGKICRLDSSMPNKDTIFTWLLQDQNFSDQYARAREARAEARSDKIDEITDDVRDGSLDPQAARVIIDAEKWQAGKENPKRYGEKVQTEHSGALEVTEIKRTVIDPRNPHT